MSNGPAWFPVNLAYRPTFKAISSAAVGDGLKASLDYFATGELPPNDMNPLARVVFDTLREGIDEAFAAYNASVEAGRYGAKVKADKHRQENTSPPRPP